MGGMSEWCILYAALAKAGSTRTNNNNKRQRVQNMTANIVIRAGRHMYDNLFCVHLLMCIFMF